MEQGLSPKVRAYIRASVVIGRTRVERGVYPRAVAKAIGAELKKISVRLRNSARNVAKREALRELEANHPEWAKSRKKTEAILGCLRAMDKYKNIMRGAE